VIGGHAAAGPTDRNERGELATDVAVDVQPGPTATDMNPDEGQYADASKSFIALGRYGLPPEVAGVVSYLAGPESGLVTSPGRSGCRSRRMRA
jgi:NAD(P)-dependent dehydrogenase (short-subunit alcohol dehydrogenase family)